MLIRRNLFIDSETDKNTTPPRRYWTVYPSLRPSTSLIFSSLFCLCSLFSYLSEVLQMWLVPPSNFPLSYIALSPPLLSPVTVTARRHARRSHLSSLANSPGFRRQHMLSRPSTAPAPLKKHQSAVRSVLLLFRRWRQGRTW